MCLSDDIVQYVSRYGIVSNFANFSDHEAVSLVLIIPVVHYFSKVCDPDLLSGPSEGPSLTTTFKTPPLAPVNVGQLRFDHANIPAYYDCTRELLQPVADNLNIALASEYSRGNSTIESIIETAYCRRTEPCSVVAHTYY